MTIYDWMCSEQDYGYLPITLCHDTKDEISLHAFSIALRGTALTAAFHPDPATRMRFHTECMIKLHDKTLAT